MLEGLSVDPKSAAALQQAVQSGRLSHAVILEGADAETRKLAATQLAKAIVCTGDRPPCGVCRACKKAQSGNHPDIHFLEKDEKSAFLKVDAVRALKELAMLLPNDGERSVFVILEAQFMNVQAQNALLKILEEPAKHVHFILTADSKSILLETIRSRATSFSLQQSDVSPALQSEEGKQAARAVLQALCGTEFDLLTACAVFQKDKALLQAALGEMELILRDALLSGVAVQTLTEEHALAEKLRGQFTTGKLLQMRAQLGELLSATKANANQNLTATALSALLYETKERVDI
ncbi:MAG: hypothetical protein IJU56_03825 [Clostridia bacterium]|nr:hypothetical protein [Clostridia bacterium]